MPVQELQMRGGMIKVGPCSWLKKSPGRDQAEQSVHVRYRASNART